MEDRPDKPATSTPSGARDPKPTALQEAWAAAEPIMVELAKLDPRTAAAY